MSRADELFAAGEGPDFGDADSLVASVELVVAINRIRHKIRRYSIRILMLAVPATVLMAAMGASQWEQSPHATRVLGSVMVGLLLATVVLLVNAAVRMTPDAALASCAAILAVLAAGAVSAGRDGEGAHKIVPFAGALILYARYQWRNRRAYRAFLAQPGARDMLAQAGRLASWLAKSDPASDERIIAYREKTRPWRSDHYRGLLLDDLGFFVERKSRALLCERRGSLIIGNRVPGKNGYVPIVMKGTAVDARMSEEHFERLARWNSSAA
jgi:hypothetical protein